MSSRRTDPKDVHKYSFFNPKLNKAAYATGDIYSKETVAGSQKDWEVHCPNNEYPYLRHIKALSGKWPHLRLLADFMEIGSSPLRWGGLNTDEEKQNHAERIVRTNVTRLDYFVSGAPESKPCKTPLELRTALEESEKVTDPPNARTFRLYVVEDLSREVIELLGSKLDIEPAFFRSHICDYAWYNTRDRWIDTRCMDVVAHKKRWIQLRFATARYFKTPESFTAGGEQFEGFNVYRRLEDDQNNKAMWDERGAIVGLARTRASFWVGGKGEDEGKIGVLLLDPTVKEGFPLWHGYCDWEGTPSMHSHSSPDPPPPYPLPPPRDSIFSDFIYWAKKPSAFAASSPSTSTTVLLPMQALIYLVCSEWLMISEYIRTRIGQIDWEISFPKHFLAEDSNIDECLKKLTMWHRLVPLYREMLTETLHQLETFPVQNSRIFQAHDIPVGYMPSTLSATNPISALSTSFSSVLDSLHEYQKRIDLLTSVVIARISIEDSRRSRDDNRNVTRLTWLAFAFVPLSFVASLFSMQNDLKGLDYTLRLYCYSALPTAVVSLGIARLLRMPAVQNLGSKSRKGDI